MLCQVKRNIEDIAKRKVGDRGRLQSTEKRKIIRKQKGFSKNS
jgi:hypothetical protein